MQAHLIDDEVCKLKTFWLLRSWWCCVPKNYWNWPIFDWVISTTKKVDVFWDTV